jgi:hypothetical protein
MEQYVEQTPASDVAIDEDGAPTCHMGDAIHYRS